MGLEKSSGAVAEEPSAPVFRVNPVRAGFWLWSLPVVLMAVASFGACSGQTDGAGGQGTQSSTTVASGPGCTGTPAPCEGRSAFECSSFYGCRSGGSCSGLAEACSALVTEQPCNLRLGCAWNSSRTECTGLAEPCAGLKDPLVCAGQGGCAWGGTGCSGSPTRCDYISSRAGCDEQPGCVWK